MQSAVANGISFITITSVYDRQSRPRRLRSRAHALRVRFTWMDATRSTLRPQPPRLCSDAGLQIAALRAQHAPRLAPQFPASPIPRLPTWARANSLRAPWWKKRHVGGQPGDNNEHCDLRGCASRPIGRFSPPLRARPRGESELAGRGLAAAYNPNNAQCARRTT